MSRGLEKRYLGVDIGGTSAKCALVDTAGSVSCRESFETGISVSREQFLHSLMHAVDHAAGQGIEGVGICCLGVVNPRTGQILGAVENMPYLNGMNLGELIGQRHPGLSVHVGNDVKAVARCEHWIGAAKGCDNFACFALGTGLGGAIVIGGELLEGVHFRAGEVCYTDYQGSDDYLEKYTSTQNVMQQAATQLGVESMDGFRFFELVRAGNPPCLEILAQWTERIARFVANVVVLLDLERVIIGGGVSREGDILIPRLSAAVDRRLPPEFRGQTEIVAAKFAGDAGVLGAVAPLVNVKKARGGLRGGTDKGE